MAPRNKGNKKHTSGVQSVMGFKAENDGVDHINIHSMGRTELGRLLSHFAHTPFIHPYYGPFYSMEGFWYWARSGFTEDRMRYLSGFRAKKVGQGLEYHWYEEFKDDVLAANYQKIIQHENIREMVIASKLPFDHYYTFGPNSIHVTPNSTEWLVQGFEDIRLALQEGVVPSVWLRSEARYLKKD